jgi:LacI family transcriptional regulator
LNGNPRISLAMRERVRAAASELGYVPDAKMGELMARVRGGRQEGFHGTLGVVYLTGQPSELKWRKNLLTYTRGILEQAESLGYRVDSFWPEAEGLQPARLQAIFRQRGIEGIILAMPPAQTDSLRYDWAGFAWVALGFAIMDPPLHMVTPDWSGDAVEATQYLLRQGMQRIGLAWDSRTDQKTGNAWLCGYAGTLLAAGREPRVFFSKEESYRGLKSWIRREKTDSLLLHSSHVEDILAETKLQPRLVYLNLSEDRTRSEGLITSCLESGSSAVDVVVGQLRRGERGIPRYQKKLRTQGRWMAPHR